jgi:Rieske Fe-S protein
LVEISRRDFCLLAGGTGIAVMTGCMDGGVQPVETGKLGAHTGGPADAPSGDAPKQTADAPSGVACSTNPIDVGPASGYALNKPQYFSSGNFFVVKDSGGFYALTAVCTHAGATCQAQTSQFYCPRHGATFDFNGNVTQGPAFLPLQHYAMCNMSNGHLGVMTSMTVSASARIVG